MIKLTRLNGSVLSLNPDLIHRAEETPDTVLTLIDGSRYVVRERLDELITLVVGYRARVVAHAGLLAEAGPTYQDDMDVADVADDADHADDEAPGGVSGLGGSVVRLRARRA